MTITQNLKAIVLATICVLFAAYAGASYIADKSLSNTKNTLEESINEKEKTLIDLADKIAKGRTSALAERVMPDCSVAEQAQFDNRLIKLDTGLNKQELVELNNLFSRCAPVKSVQRSIMVAQLEEAVRSYQQFIKHRTILGGYEVGETKSMQWEDLLAEELAITDLTIDLVGLQGEIIEALLSGLSVNSAAAAELRNEGQTLRNELQVLVESANKMRSLLIKSDN